MDPLIRGAATVQPPPAPRTPPSPRPHRRAIQFHPNNSERTCQPGPAGAVCLKDELAEPTPTGPRDAMNAGCNPSDNPGPQVFSRNCLCGNECFHGNCSSTHEENQTAQRDESRLPARSCCFYMVGFYIPIYSVFWETVGVGIIEFYQ
ncbi:hypothetical protein DPEC_G00273150 [Dallia pectoralis]|uniref:Uncharacterized protein n=1 Tax=Dallia pectoralis TaxID=75939 RepID=A0ACC2FQ65_DALPE|nr:hypothetical protein DPEC_G00273150 [Dallia pectoralis]